MSQSAGINASPAYACYVLAVLSLVSVLNYYDRNLIAMLVGPIQADLHISDTQIGLLSGLMFALVYTIAGVPVARLADSLGRIRTLGACLAIWSASTIACGYASSFATLGLARLGVALGESGGLPTTHAVAADYFSARRRATALGLIAVAAALGVSLATVGAGLISDRYGWQMAFLAGGVPGLAVAALVILTVREPARSQPQVNRAINLRSALRMLWQRRAYACLCAGMAFGSMGMTAQSSWNPAFLMRMYDITAGQVAATYGVAYAITTLIATFLGGLITDYLSTRDQRWPWWVLAGAFAVATPLSFAFYLTHELQVVLALLIPLAVVSTLWAAPAYALIQSYSGPKLRATGAAIFMLIVNLIGLGLGPSVPGLLSDLLAPMVGAQGLRYSLLAMTLSFPIASLLFLQATRSAIRDLKDAEEA